MAKYFKQAKLLFLVLKIYHVIIKKKFSLHMKTVLLSFKSNTPKLKAIMEMNTVIIRQMDMLFIRRLRNM